MHTKTLPIGHPPIIGYLHHAYPLGILSQDEMYLPWFYSHYIQVHCPAELASGPDPHRKRKFNFYRPPGRDDAPGPGLSRSRYDRDLVLVEVGVMDFIRRAILSDKYVQVCVDEFEIPGKKAFQRRHLLHEVLIYGFSDKSRCVMTLGFRANGDFASLGIPYDDLRRAFEAVPRKNAYDQEGLRLFHRDATSLYAFDLQAVIEGLEDYVFSQNTSARFRMLSAPIEGVFGLETYRCLIEACSQLFAHPHWFDIRPLHILCEHKSCMLRRIRYLEVQGSLNATDGFGDLYGAIETEARTLRMMMLKLRTSGEEDILRRIIHRLEKLVLDEGRILMCLLETLRAMQVGVSKKPSMS